MNYALIVSYHPQQYRLLKSYKLANFFGLRPDFLDFNTFAISTASSPLQSDEIYPDLARELYDGLFVLRKDARIREIKTEVMQHTVISSIALAGGGYSVLTGVYVLLFGMSKVSPWGIAHIIPMYVKRKQQSKKNDEENADSINEKIEEGARNIFKLNSLPGKKFTPLDPTEMSNPYSNVSESIPQEASFMLPTHIDIDESNTVTKSVLLNNKCETSSKPNNIKENQDSKELIKLRKETAMLATEMKELKIILSEYFIDTKYMDQLRFKKKPTSSSDDPELIFN
ncbi:uncharacterized protein EV154DRAFT_325961 [Mucor mucedo]|uniref:uncharacterized protein n=1 Tax=Mucor mucedo TaxID=29922 RepID=UPI00221F8061|nr:uncharacterized protein EV154DRAFT_325961 [Mucor mucedo]KAI7887984.1 hypothetical protein EV154DRAFT_325961 [Mucor mucedo]